MTKMMSTEDGQAIWLDVCFCQDCEQSQYNPSGSKEQPYFCPLWNEWMKSNDFCSKGKEE